MKGSYIHSHYRHVRLLMNKVLKTNQITFSLRRILCFIIIVSVFACRDKENKDVRPNFSGKYVGTIQGTFYKDFSKPTGVPFSEPAEFSISDDGKNFLITGFDSIPAKLEFGNIDDSEFGISDVRSTGDFRIGASGNFNGDTLKMTGRYVFLDRSIRQYRFVGVRR